MSIERSADIRRETKETRINIKINLDGSGQAIIDTGIGFFNHLLDALTKHSGFDLSIEAKGDLHIDSHHTVEDVGITLGQVFDKALGKREKICRFGHAYCPLDEALARSVVDISGRSYFQFDCKTQFGKIGQFDGELYEEFLRAFTINAKITLHLAMIKGKNQHHILEAMTKSLARSLRMAVRIDPNEMDVPSTKGVLV